MKFKYLIVMASFFTALLMGCKKDKIDTRPVSEAIVGSWGVHTIEGRVMNGATLEQVISISRGSTSNAIIVFGANNAFLFDKLVGGIDAGTYTVTGTQVTTISAPTSYIFEVLTSSKDLLTLKEVRANYPGYPGKIVEVYYSCLPL